MRGKAGPRFARTPPMSFPYPVPAISRSCGALLATSAVTAAISVGGCKKKTEPEPAQQVAVESASVQPPPVPGAPVPPEKLQQAINPKGFPPYSGPAGTVRGVVRVRGDEPPVLSEMLEKIPASKCPTAVEMYGKLFREGEGRTLADVLVAVTGYDAFVPAEGEARRVVARNCTWDTRTIALTLGQRIDVLSKGPETYLPHLLGSRSPAVMVTVPGGDAVPLYPTEAGKYVLVDKVHSFTSADVFVLNYPTVDVTGLDGRFEISGVPAGEVRVSALLPVIGQTAEKTVQVAAGEALELELEIVFDAEEHAPAAPVERVAE